VLHWLATILSAGTVTLALHVMPSNGAILAEDPSLTVASVKASALAARLEKGQGVDLAGVTVVGTLDVREAGTVRSPIRCVSCRFADGIVARDVIFERVVDLSGSTIEGPIDAVGSVLRGGLLFRSSDASPAAIDGPVDFSRATFGDTTSFDGATLADTSDFTGSRFLRRASFADVLFVGDTSFDDVAFDGDAIFSSLAPDTTHDARLIPCAVAGTFAGRASFDRAAFSGALDFRQRCFVSDATFLSATLGKRADFTLANFHGPTSFEGASFEGDGAFLASSFDEEVSFQRASAARSLVFEDAWFSGHANFNRLAVNGTMSLKDALIVDTVDLRESLVGDLTMDLADLARVTGLTKERKEVLENIEESADARGDLALANDARFQLLALRNTEQGGFSRVVDWFFYRSVAGYLVRPVYPLLAFLELLLVGALVRTWLWWRRRRRRPPTDDASDPPRKSMVTRGHARVLGVAHVASAFFQRLGDTVRIAFIRKPDVTLEDTEHIRPYLVAAVQWSEWIAFKVLIALFLLALASSNATLKQLIDAVRG
jgi:hypothetical protein